MAISNGEFAVLKAALKLQLAASWQCTGPCEYEEVDLPKSGYYIRTPRGFAVQFTVLGRRIIDLGDQVNAGIIAEILVSQGAYTESSTPHSGRATVHAVHAIGTDEATKTETET